MPRLDRDELLLSHRGLNAGRCTFQLLFVNQPIHKRADGIGKRFLNRCVGDPLFAVRLGNGKHHHRWLLRRIGPERLERNVAGLRRA